MAMSEVLHCCQPRRIALVSLGLLVCQVRQSNPPASTHRNWPSRGIVDVKLGYG